MALRDVVAGVVLQVYRGVAHAYPAGFLPQHMVHVVNQLLLAVLSHRIHDAVLTIVDCANGLSLRLEHAPDLKHRLTHAQRSLLLFRYFLLALCRRLWLVCGGCKI